MKKNIAAALWIINFLGFVALAAINENLPTPERGKVLVGMLCCVVTMGYAIIHNSKTE